MQFYTYIIICNMHTRMLLAILYLHKIEMVSYELFFLFYFLKMNYPRYQIFFFMVYSQIVL